MRSQAHRTVRVDGIWIGLGLMVLSAILVIVALAMIVPWFLSLGSYIESIAP